MGPLTFSMDSVVVALQSTYIQLFPGIYVGFFILMYFDLAPYFP